MRAYKAFGYGGKQYLSGGQTNLDKNNDGRISAEDFELLRKLKEYMNGGKMYENGGSIEERAKAPEEVSDLLKGLETLGKRNEPLTGRELEEKLKMLRMEQKRASFSRDLRDPNMMFNVATRGEYSGLSDVSDAVAAKAEDFYQNEIDKLRTQAYAISASKDRTSLPPMLKEGEIVEIIRRAMEQGKI